MSLAEIERQVIELREEGLRRYWLAQMALRAPTAHNKPAQGNALGKRPIEDKALKGRDNCVAPSGLSILFFVPRALPWAGMWLGLWPGKLSMGSKYYG